MRFPDALDPAGFLHGFWQKSPLFVQAAIDASAPRLTGDELAWLATQADVESRLIFTDRSAVDVRYRVEHGPFDDRTLMNLPAADWTLLVQDVEKHLPDLRAWFDHVPFVPDWRIDDLMVSFAAAGGSVGPHQDNYDVFLCQGLGRREWRLAGPGSGIPSDASAELNLLRPFAGEPVHVANETDVLYLPPGVPHWGIALCSCMTYSIGMRAPEWVEFACAAERLYPDRGLHRSAEPHTALFYQDADLQANEAAPGRIGASALRRARAQFTGARALSEHEFATAFGSLVTDPKAWLAPDRPDASDLADALGSLPARSELAIHGMARVAFTDSKSVSCDNHLLFANGFHRAFDSALTDPIAQLCRLRRLDGVNLARWIAEPARRELLEWLITKGVFDISRE